MANYTSWLDISSMSGGSGRTSLTLTASRNYDDVDKSAQIVAYNPVYNVSATTTVYIQRHSIYPIPYTADTSLVDFTGETRTITIDASDLVTSSITVTVYGATGVTTSYNGGVVTVVFPENFGNERDISIAITGVTTDNIDAEAVIDYRQAAFNAQESYLTFLVESPGAIRWTAVGDSANAKTIEYKKNNGNWTSITATTAGTPINVAAGDVVMFRGDNAAYAYDESFWNSFEYTDCQFSLVGNIMSLVNSTGFSELTALTADYTFQNIFRLCTGLTSASGLVLPATALSTGCYEAMFFDCTGLTSTPELPATTLADSCYSEMFRNCTSLTTAPELPTTTLAESCYGQMFGGCTSLTGVPSNYLPATTLAESCYAGMFENCTALTSAPVLPATSLRTRCYAGMFLNCESLVNAPTLPARTIASYCYQDMFAGCTSLTSAPELPATTLANGCYQSMFSGCTSLTTAPVLPALTLVEACYAQMFKGCSGINYIECYATSTAATDCTTNWVSGVAYSGTFVKHPDMNSWTIGVNGIPVNWIVQDGDVPSTHYLTFTVESAGTIVWKAGNTRVKRTVEYKKNSGEWTSITSNTGSSAPFITVNAGDVVMFRGDNSSYGDYVSTRIYGNSFGDSTCKFSASGNIMSLVNSTGFSGETVLSGSFNFSYMFENCTGLTSAENLILPATSCTQYCYYNMFSGCTSLVRPPEIYGFNLTFYCYRSMFENCTSLLTAPELPAEYLPSGCYRYMFKGCSSLIAAPPIPATGVVSEACWCMFSGCTSLTTAPSILLATTLGKNCYAGMFYDCTSLTTAPTLPATTLAEDCYNQMFRGCTSLTAAPALPADTLYTRCYEGMFESCTSLTTAPALPATTLADYCYNQMFLGCSSLITAPSVLPATTLAASCYLGMFEGCTSLTTAPELPGTTLAERCYHQMFINCTSLTSAPSVLPATTLATSCYYGMFYGCTSLTTAPDLPAKTLASNCYQYMFNGCSSLNYLKCLATNTGASDCTRDWVRNVASAGTFIENHNMIGWTTGNSGIPTNWVVRTQYEYMPLTFKVTSGGSINWLHNRTLVSDVGDLTIQYRINGGTWTSITSSTGGSSFNVQTDDIVEFQGNNAAYGTLPLSYTSFSGSTAEFEAYGNVLSLISGTGFDTITALTQQYTFNRLFAGCTGLTNAEYLEIPAQTITMHCYSSMFQDCSNMTAGPTLPAPTLQNSCYNEMFNGCSSLANIKCLATDVSAYNCTYNWVSNVASSGTFVKASTMSGWGSGNSGIPSNWSSRNFTY